jgi:hypothetical protein
MVGAQKTPIYTLQLEFMLEVAFGNSLASLYLNSSNSDHFNKNNRGGQPSVAVKVATVR